MPTATWPPEARRTSSCGGPRTPRPRPASPTVHRPFAFRALTGADSRLAALLTDAGQRLSATSACTQASHRTTALATRRSHPRSVRLTGCGATPETGMDGAVRHERAHDGEISLQFTVVSPTKSLVANLVSAAVTTTMPAVVVRCATARSCWFGPTGHLGSSRSRHRLIHTHQARGHSHLGTGYRSGIWPTSGRCVAGAGCCTGSRRLPGRRRAHLPGQVAARVPMGRSIADIPNQISQVTLR